MGKARGVYKRPGYDTFERAHRDAELVKRWGSRIQCPPGPGFFKFRRDVKACTPDMWKDIVGLRRRSTDRQRHAKQFKRASVATARDRVRLAVGKRASSDEELQAKWGERILCEPGADYIAFREDVIASGAPPAEWADIRGLRRRLNGKLAAKRARDRAKERRETAFKLTLLEPAPIPLPPPPIEPLGAGCLAPCPHCSGTGFTVLPE